MKVVLKLENVTKEYTKGKMALCNINLEVKQGEFISIIGPSGSGKSTLLRSINKLIDITDGSINVDGNEISKQKGRALRASRRKIGMVFQHYNLVYRLSVLQNVLHGRLGYMSGINGMLGLYEHEDKLRALRLLDELGLKDFAYNRSSELSGGQKQRVGIARAIMQSPHIMLCDEPIASLDPSSAKTIMDLLKQTTSKRNIACIVNLHQLDVAKTYSTRIIGLSKGKIVFDDTPDKLTSEAIEKIYGTSCDNLMIGNSSNDAT